jgi:hypothetical protein
MFRIFQLDVIQEVPRRNFENIYFLSLWLTCLAHCSLTVFTFVTVLLVDAYESCYSYLSHFFCYLQFTFFPQSKRPCFLRMQNTWQTFCSTFTSLAKSRAIGCFTSGQTHVLEPFSSSSRSDTIREGIRNVRLCSEVVRQGGKYRVLINGTRVHKITRGAEKFLARPGRKKATATNLGMYSTYSLRSSIHFLTRFCNF